MHIALMIVMWEGVVIATGATLTSALVCLDAVLDL